MDHPFHEPKPSAAVPKSFVALIGEPPWPTPWPSSSRHGASSSQAQALALLDAGDCPGHWIASRIAACALDRAPASPPAPQCGSHGTRNQKPRQSQVQCPRRNQSFCRRQQHARPRCTIVPEWSALMKAIPEVKASRLLSGIARYCSSRGAYACGHDREARGGLLRISS